ncbi:MAG: rod shape-determining protein MreC [Candidatus Omnitrophica bacterium]|nr:rod shape-determining protein MreC [Candidatus Omnitrophota bacterium]
MFRKFPKQVFYALIALVPFGLLFFNSPFFHGVKLNLMGMATASVAVARWPLKEAEILITYRKTYTQYQKLNRDVTALKSRIVSLEELSQENVRYEKLLQFKNRQMYASVTALVVARDPANWNSSLMINKGKSDGVRPGMPVVNASGVVGKVAEVSETSAKVILVNDPGFNVAVINRRSRESALLSGSLSGKCRMFYLPENADVKVGDEIITSKLSNEFPDGIVVGVVTDVFPPEGLSSARAEVDPEVELGKIEEVLVIK